MTGLKQRCGGIFTADPDTPPEVRYAGGVRVERAFCVCGLVGRPGDAHHAMPEVPEQAEHERRYGDDTHDGGEN